MEPGFSSRQISFPWRAIVALISSGCMETGLAGCFAKWPAEDGRGSAETSKTGQVDLQGSAAITSATQQETLLGTIRNPFAIQKHPDSR